MRVTDGVKRLYSSLASTGLAVALFLTISVLAIPGTFAPFRFIYTSPLFLGLLIAFGINLLLCTLQRIKTISKPVLILHCGVLITLCGCVVTSLGFVATVNVYEGGVTDKAYRWDMDRDIPLGVDLVIKKINREYLPIPVKVGVLKWGDNDGLFVQKTGESFLLNRYTVRIDALELPAKNLKLSVYEDGRLLGNCDTSGFTTVPADFPYSFKLVAYKTPVLKRLWVDLFLASGPEIVAEGVTEVNNPFVWNGLYFYNTQVDTDPKGAPYAGIQIVKDPGRPYVFTGFAVVAIGVVMTYLRRFRMKGL